MIENNLVQINHNLREDVLACAERPINLPITGMHVLGYLLENVLEILIIPWLHRIKVLAIKQNKFTE